MTGAQELANAASMALPLAWACCCPAGSPLYTDGSASPFDRAEMQSWTRSTCAMLLALVGSTTCSILYHLRCAGAAFGLASMPLACRVDNPWRRLDHTAIHVTWIIWTYALSCTAYPWYTALAGLFNACAIALIWRREVVPNRNQLNVLIGILLYLLPMLWRRDFFNLSSALAWMVPGVIIFRTYALGGYSHAIFHVFEMGFTHSMLKSTTLC